MEKRKMMKVIVLLTVLSIVGGAKANLVTNGDFENATALYHWFYSSGVTETADNGPSAAGAECATMTTIRWGGGGFSQLGHPCYSWRYFDAEF